MSLRNTRENAQFVCESQDNNDITSGSGLKGWKPHLSTLKDAGFDASKWISAKIVQSALLCTQASPEDHPLMSEVVRMLEGERLAERWEEWQYV
ncbi:hypothetical protein JHK85_028767 [Glycine max]|nr:hypothetical protein JHK85_028767 [Glycine max]